jgi:hypothetical protein
MNKAITDAIVFNPLPFAAGLGVWSSGDGTPGSDTYAVSGSGVFVAADQDFAGCLEVLKVGPIARVRYMGQTPVLPGCYLRVTVRVKAVAGLCPLCASRVAGAREWHRLDRRAHDRPCHPADRLWRGVTISAIIATAARTGLIWSGPGRITAIWGWT